MKAEEVYQCGKCGLCLSTCPVYDQMRDESAGPRAKVQLIKHYAAKDLPTSGHLNRIVSRCLMCGTCTANCPSGVRHDLLFMRMRSFMADDHGVDWKMRMVFHLLSHDDQLKLASKMAKLGRKAVLGTLAKDARIGNIPVEKMPDFNRKPFRDQVQEISGPDQHRGTVLYFTGCGTNYVYEKIGRSVVNVLTRMGFQVVIPKDQVCCGLPLFFHGQMKKAEKNVLTNIEVLRRTGIEAIVVDCATCGAALKKEYPALLKEMGTDAGAAEEISEKVTDISAFLIQHLGRLKPLLAPDKAVGFVTYHMPCHLKNTPDMALQIKDLLTALPGSAYVQAADENACCGGGGTFFYDHPDISKQMVDKKIENAKATGSRFWATGCPGCRVNLSGNLGADDTIKVVHPIELVDMALR